MATDGIVLLAKKIGLTSFTALTDVKKALETNEKICIYGDYDADGITATALVFHYLKNTKASTMPSGILDKADFPCSGSCSQPNDQNNRRKDNPDPYAVLSQIIPQRTVTPFFASISPSLQTGSPITLKKSPSIALTNRAPFPCAP